MRCFCFIWSSALIYRNLLFTFETLTYMSTQSYFIFFLVVVMNFILLLSVLNATIEMLSLHSSAGWLGNDAISPIIGEHDPYYHVSARVWFIFLLLLQIQCSIPLILEFRKLASNLRETKELGLFPIRVYFTVASIIIIILLLISLVRR